MFEVVVTVQGCLHLAQECSELALEQQLAEIATSSSSSSSTDSTSNSRVSSSSAGAVYQKDVQLLRQHVNRRVDAATASTLHVSSRGLESSTSNSAVAKREQSCYMVTDASRLAACHASLSHGVHCCNEVKHVLAALLSIHVVLICGHTCTNYWAVFCYEASWFCSLFQRQT